MTLSDDLFRFNVFQVNWLLGIQSGPKSRPISMDFSFRLSMTLMILMENGSLGKNLNSNGVSVEHTSSTFPNPTADVTVVTYDWEKMNMMLEYRQTFGHNWLIDNVHGMLPLNRTFLDEFFDRFQMCRCQRCLKLFL